MKPKLIVVDDEPALAGFVCDVAEQAGYEAELFLHAEDFKQDYRGDADIIVLDLLLPGIDGVEVIRYLAQIGCKSRLILVSGFDAGVLHSAQKLAIEHGLTFIGSLNKPFRHHELFHLLEGLPISPKGNLPTEDWIITVDELLAALDRHELVIHYQPKIELQSGAVAGFEALVRWQHPMHGLLGPDLFVPLAEQNNLIDDLTWDVLGQVAAQCRAFDSLGIRHPVAVNMSATTLQELALPERLAELVEEFSIDSSRIMLEVTETTLMQELIKSLDILTRLRMKGFDLSIDDFGTGYSSLVQLHRAPFSELKIDRSFVLDMGNDKEASTIVETVIVLGHKLGMQVVAEGVETQANLEQLTAMGCDMAQGYHFARPQPADAIIDWLKHQSLLLQD